VPTGTPTGTGRWWSHRRRRPSPSGPDRSARWHTTAGRCRSGAEPDRRRSARAAPRWRWPACCAPPGSEIPCGTAAPLRRQTRFDVAQRLAKRQLREGHRVELVQTREALDLVLAVVARHAAPKRRQRQVRHDLRENELALMHRHPERARPAKGRSLRLDVQIETRPERRFVSDRSSTYQRLA
jgi:hypothetical protein